MRYGWIFGVATLLPSCHLLFQLDPVTADPADGGSDGTSDGTSDGSDAVGLVLHLTFDEAPYQDVAGGHTVTCPSGCPSHGADRNGVLSAASFNATSTACLQISNVAPSNTMTFALWAKVRSTGIAHVFSRPRDVVQGSNAYEAYILDAMTWAIEVNSTLLTVDIAAADTWHHFAGSYDGTTFGLYLDGMLRNTTLVGPLVYGSTAVLVGCEDNGGLESFVTGEIDDVRLYDRALSSSEIAQLAQ